MSKKIEWRDVLGREGEYKVSSDGQIYSIPRKITMRNGTTRMIGGKILSPSRAGYGYWAVQLGAGKRGYIHRLVAKAFLGDMGPGYEVNHKDENKNNNCLENLEWLEKSKNLSYGTRAKRSGAKRNPKAVIAMKDGLVVMTFGSIHEAAKSGFHRANVSRCCHGKALQYKGLEWRFKEKATPGDTTTEDGKAVPQHQ